MSNQVGITATRSLREKFAEMKDGHIRVVVVAIENEKLICKHEHNAERSFNQDFDKMIPPLVENTHAAYYFIRLDTISEINGHNWLLITYIPEEAKTRERTLYASAIPVIKREFGVAYITQEVRVSSKDEMIIPSFHQHLHTAQTGPSRTMHSEDMNESHQRENNAHVGVLTRQAAAQGVKYPFDENVIEAIHLFKKHNVDYVQFDIDHVKELMLLSHSEAHATPEHIRKHLPDHEGRYHLYRFRHDHNHKRVEAVFFLYSIPGAKIDMKQRMAYANCKDNVIENIERKFSIVFDKKLEICDSTDFTAEYLLKQLYPETFETTSFTKTKAPQGTRRLVKTADGLD